MDTRRTVSPGLGAISRLAELEQRLLDLEDAVGELQDVLEVLVQRVGLEPLEELVDTQEPQEKLSD